MSKQKKSFRTNTKATRLRFCSREMCAAGTKISSRKETERKIIDTTTTNKHHNRNAKNAQISSAEEK